MVVVTLQTMGGASIKLPPMFPTATVRELATQIRFRLNVPISLQNLILGVTALEDPSRQLVEVFGQVEAVNLTVVRRRFKPNERKQLYKQLVRAVGAGRFAQVRELLQEGAQVNFSPECGAFEDAVVEDIQDVSETEDGGFAVSAEAKTPCGGLTPLMMAIAMRDDALIRVLRECGATEPDMEPVHPCLGDAFGSKDFPDIVRHIANGANVNFRLFEGQGIQDTMEGRPLHACAALYKCPGAYEVAQLLIWKNADLALGDSEEGATPLAHARYFGATKIHQLLQGHGPEIVAPYDQKSVAALNSITDSIPSRL